MSWRSVGTIVGYYYGGAWGALAGGAIGGAIDGPADTSKLEDLKAAKVSLGQPIPHIFGHPREAGNIAWISDAIESGTTGGGGKGSSGGGGAATYIRNILIVMGEDVTGPPRKIWFAGKLVYNVSSEADDDTIDASVEDGMISEVIYYNGDDDQLADPTYEEAIGTGNAPAHRGHSTMMLKGVACGPSGQMPNITFEVSGKEAGENIGKTARILTGFAEATYRGDPPEGSSAGGISVTAIYNETVRTYGMNGNIASNAAPTGADIRNPGSGNGNRAVSVFGLPGGNACFFAVAGDGLQSTVVSVSDPNGLLGTSEIRFSIWRASGNTDIAVGTEIEYGTGFGPGAPFGNDTDEAEGALGFVYVHRLGDGNPELAKIDVHATITSVNSIAMNASKVWVYGSGAIEEYDRGDGYANSDSFSAASGSNTRIFISQGGELCCANSAAEIYKWSTADRLWNLFVTMDDLVEHGSPVDLGTNTCHHVVRGASAYALKTTQKTLTSHYTYPYFVEADGNILDPINWRATLSEVVYEDMMINGNNVAGVAGEAWAARYGDPYTGPRRAWTYDGWGVVSDTAYGDGRQYVIYGHKHAMYKMSMGDAQNGFQPFDIGMTVYQFFATIPPGEPDPRFYVDVFRKRLDVDLYDLTEPTLQEVVENLSVRAGLTIDQIDAEELSTKYVHALAVTQVGPTASTLDMLMSVYKFYCTETGGQLVFRFYGSSPVRKLAFNELGATTGDTPAEALPLAIGSELEQPSMQSVRYSNIDDSYQDGLESADRLLQSTQSANVTEYAIGLTPTEAKRLAVTNQQVALASLIRLGPVSVGPENRDIEAGDSIVFTRQDGTQIQGFCSKLTIDPNGMVTMEPVSEDSAAYSSDALTSGNYTNAVTVSRPPQTEFELLDIPLLPEEADGAHLDVVARPTSFPWHGYSLQKGATESNTTEIYRDNRIGVFGTCETVLADWTGPNVIDYISRVTVVVPNGVLSSITRHELLTSRLNLCMVGEEMLQYQTADLIAANTYILSGFIRYLGGTESASHLAEERFVFLKSDTLSRVTMNVADLGISRYWKAVTIGRNPNTVDAVEFAPEFVCLKPIAPSNTHAVVRTNGDVLLRWHRRTRYQSNALRGIVPLDYSSEGYTIEVYDGAVLKRTLTSTSPQVTYTVANQATDLPSGGNATFHIRQIGAIQGHAAEVSLEI